MTEPNFKVGDCVVYDTIADINARSPLPIEDIQVLEVSILTIRNVMPHWLQFENHVSAYHPERFKLVVEPAPQPEPRQLQQIKEKWRELDERSQKFPGDHTSAGAWASIGLFLDSLTDEPDSRDARIAQLKEWNDTQARSIKTFQSREHETAKQIIELDSELTKALKKRDEYHDKLDEFAYTVASQSVIGEHSHGNDPWENALELLASVETQVEQARQEERDAIKATWAELSQRDDLPLADLWNAFDIHLNPVKAKTVEETIIAGAAASQRLLNLYGKFGLEEAKAIADALRGAGFLIEEDS